MAGFGCVLLLLLLLLLVGGGSVLVFQRVAAGVEQFKQRVAVARLIAQVNSDTTLLHQRVRAFAVSGDPGQREAVQQATQEAVAAIRSIGRTIGQISEITTMIAAAVEQQGAATREIARNVQQASTGTSEVSSNIAGVSRAMASTGEAADQVLGVAGALSQQSQMLQGKIETFLAGIKAA